MWSSFTASCPDLSRFASLNASDEPTPPTGHQTGHQTGQPTTNQTESQTQGQSHSPSQPGHDGASISATAARPETSRAQRRAGDDAPRASMVQARQLLGDPDTPPYLVAKLRNWSEDHGRRADALMALFDHEFRALATAQGPQWAQEFETRLLPSLRQAAVVSVALGMDTLPALRDFLNKGAGEAKELSQVGRCYGLPAALAPLLVAAAAVLTLKENAEPPDVYAPPGGGSDAGMPWVAGAVLLAATPLFAWIDSLGDIGRRSLENNALLGPRASFGNALASHLHQCPSRSERRQTLRDAAATLLTDAILRVCLGTAVIGALPVKVPLTAYLLVDAFVAAMREAFIAQAVLGGPLGLKTPPPIRDFMTLSSREFPRWATQLHRDDAGRGKCVQSMRDIAAGLVRPSTYARAALGVAPFMLSHFLALCTTAYPVGGNLSSRLDKDELTRGLGPPVDPLTVLALSSWASALAAITVVTSQSVRAWAERWLDPAAERLAGHAWQAVGRCRRRFTYATPEAAAAAAAAATSTATSPDCEAGMAMQVRRPRQLAPADRLTADRSPCAPQDAAHPWKRLSQIATRHAPGESVASSDRTVLLAEAALYETRL
ncbi:hypothetical protein [Roseateles amylovorans]|uniref:Uncharacterized protein n=1 Tax=Roseateles amylovorans TaxID=2978473 RepID=A0ABY6ATZ1_9BURK|nr:hypothetical protein [Roseateles amylovorans]UXH76691.1 hypothetical protein N4261_16805 [Roseateles amylovorans]